MKTILIAGTNSGVGKTTVTKAILQLLDEPQAFKCGPDFIDPSFYRYITKKRVYNLDLFCYEKEKLQYVFNRFKGQINVIEGVMGLFGGLNHTLDNYSTAHISRVLKAPVILVVDGTHKDTSIQAEVLGYIKRDERVDIKGVIINNVSPSMYQYLSNALKEINVKTYGYIPPLDEFKIEERHLGLLQAQEINNLEDKLEKLKEVTSRTISISSILSDCEHNFEYYEKDYFDEIKNIHKGKTIAITKDESFSFFYDIHLEMLEYSGASIKFISPIKDKKIPKSDSLLITGGYPELHIKKLMDNNEFIHHLKQYENPIYAECGGYIYLSSSLMIGKNKYDCIGLIKDELQMTKKIDISHFGYLDILTKDNQKIKGHEFHYSKLVSSKEEGNFFSIVNKGYQTGVKINNITAGYPHILWFSNINYFKNLFKESL